MITSKDNSLIKLCSQIKSKKHSRQQKVCLVESIKVVSQLYLKGLITHILVTKDKYDLVKDYNRAKVEVISDAIAKYLSDAMTTDGIFAVCQIPQNIKLDYSKCLVLDNIQDPTNIGAIIRSARAFGFNTIFAIDSVYPYNFKCIRASMGYLFDVNFVDISAVELSKLVLEKDIELIKADMKGEILDICVKPNGNFGIIIGNEGRGISSEVNLLACKSVRIPMEKDVESLNAGVSASIIMFKLR